MVDPGVALTWLGGCATWGQLRRMCTARRVREAVAAGRIRRLRRGRYVLPTVDAHRAEAHRRRAIVSHLSAATAHGWPVKVPATEPWMTVPRRRHLRVGDADGAHVAYRDLAPEDVHDGVTAPLRTVLDCLTRLPFDEGLAVADSALRALAVRPDELQDAVRGLRGPGAQRARQVAAVADGRATNAFESVLRAICLGVSGLQVTPQYEIAADGIWAIVDLADERLGLVIEAEGFEFHGTRRGLVRDCRRYSELTVLGWSILRFTWEDVMYEPEWVRWALEAWVARHDGRAVPRMPTVKPAVLR
jgi:very-short-patch-repair endonuclease